MAAATIGSYRNSVFGNERVVQGTVTAMANADTLTIPSLKVIREFTFVPTTNASFGFTFSSNVATLVSGGALTGVFSAKGV